MANFTAKDVNDLRKSTGVGLMDCKKALTEADGDVEKAIVILREKGLANQAKKSSRVAAEGIVTSVVEGNVGAVVEVNIETDFAANNDEFKAFVANVAKTVIENKFNDDDIDALKAAKISGGDKSVEETLQDLFIKIRENMVIRRFKRLEGVLVPYVHGGGSIGVMVKLDTDLPADKVFEVGKNCALQADPQGPGAITKAGSGKLTILRSQSSSSGLVCEAGETLINAGLTVARAVTVKDGAMFSVKATAQSTIQSLALEDGAALNIDTPTFGVTPILATTGVTLPGTGTVALKKNGGAFGKGLYPIMEKA